MAFGDEMRARAYIFFDVERECQTRNLSDMVEIHATGVRAGRELLGQRQRFVVVDPIESRVEGAARVLAPRRKRARRRPHVRLPKRVDVLVPFLGRKWMEMR